MPRSSRRSPTRGPPDVTGRAARSSREPGATRLRVDGRDVTAFCSNDYLGLADHPRVTEAFIEAAQRWGVGSGAAHLVSGHCREHRLLEEALAEFTGRPRALLFSTGYMANLAVIGAIAGRGDRVLEDGWSMPRCSTRASQAAPASRVMRMATLLRWKSGSEPIFRAQSDGVPEASRSEPVPGR